MKVCKHRRDLIEMHVKQDEARREAKAIEHVGKLDAGQSQSIALSNEFSRSACHEFLITCDKDNQ